MSAALLWLDASTGGPTNDVANHPLNEDAPLIPVLSADSLTQIIHPRVALVRRSADLKAYGYVIIVQEGPLAGKPSGLSFSFDEASASSSDRILQLLQTRFDAISVGHSSLPDYPNTVIKRLDQRFESLVGYIWYIHGGDETRAAVANSTFDRIARDIVAILRSSKITSFLEHLLTIHVLPKTLEELAHILSTTIKSGLYCDHIAIWKVEENHLSAINTDDLSAGLSMNIRNGIAGRAALRKEPIVIADFRDTRRIEARLGTRPRHSDFLERHNLRSGIFVPISLNDNIAAVVGAYYKRPHGATQVDLEIVRFAINIYASLWQEMSQLERLLRLESRIRDRAPLINSAVNIVNDMHDLVNYLKGIDSELYLAKSRRQDRDIHISRAADLSIKANELISHRKYDIKRGDTEESRTFPAARREVVKPSILMSSAVNAIRADADRHRITIEELYSFDRPINIYRAALERAVENLLSNAVKVLKIRRQRTITVASTMLGPDTLVLSVEDTGGGVMEAEQSMIFEMFHTTWGSGGLGLGLTIVQSAAELHGGVVKLDSTVGVGARFEIRLPLDKIAVGGQHRG